MDALTVPRPPDPPSVDPASVDPASVEIVDVDPRDDAAFADWSAVLEAADDHDRPGEQGWLRHEQQRISVDGVGADPDTAMELVAARRGGRVVGALRLELPRRDNLHLCELTLSVAPDARRQGTARALSAVAEQRARAHGRTTLLAACDEPPGTEGRSVNRRAALALGWSVVQQEVRRDVSLPLPAERVERLTAQCRPHATDYAVRVWRDGCPDDLAADLAELHRQMSTDVPKDEMDWREEVWDVARLRRHEDLLRGMDRTWVAAGAVHVPTGRLVAFTQMGLARADLRRAYQWETLVSAAHRGHRLGMLVKLAGLQELAASSPSTELISTWNAQENGPMIAVNDALGARVNGRLAVVQKVLV